MSLRLARFNHCFTLSPSPSILILIQSLQSSCPSLHSCPSGMINSYFIVSKCIKTCTLSLIDNRDQFMVNHIGAELAAANTSTNEFGDWYQQKVLFFILGVRWGVEFASRVALNVSLGRSENAVSIRISSLRIGLKAHAESLRNWRTRHERREPILCWAGEGLLRCNPDVMNLLDWMRKARGWINHISSICEMVQA